MLAICSQCLLCLLLENIPSYYNAYTKCAKYERQKLKSIEAGKLYNPCKISEKILCTTTV